MKLASYFALPVALGLLLPGCIFHVDTGGGWDGHSYRNRGTGSHTALQGSGISEAEVRVVPEFRSIRVEGWIDVQVVVGEAQNIEITADDNLLPFIETEVVSGELRIGLKSGEYRPSSRTIVLVTTPVLEAASIRGSADLELVGIAAASFDANIYGSGDLEASGHADRLTAAVYGSGDMNLFELESRSASVVVSGSGDIEVFATEDLDAKVVGSGDVSYRGDPKAHSQVHGSGDVRRD